MTQKNPDKLCGQPSGSQNPRTGVFSYNSGGRTTETKMKAELPPAQRSVLGLWMVAFCLSLCECVGMSSSKKDPSPTGSVPIHTTLF